MWQRHALDIDNTRAVHGVRRSNARPAPGIAPLLHTSHVRLARRHTHNRGHAMRTEWTDKRESTAHGKRIRLRTGIRISFAPEGRPLRSGFAWPSHTVRTRYFGA